MAFCIWRYIVFDVDEVKKLTSHNLLYTFYHEYYHSVQMKRKGFLIKRLRDVKGLERQAQRYAINKMIKLGYSKKDLMFMDLEYHIFNKYGWDLKVYNKQMKGGKRDK